MPGESESVLFWLVLQNKLEQKLFTGISLGPLVPRGSSIWIVCALKSIKAKYQFSFSFTVKKHLSRDWSCWVCMIISQIGLVNEQNNDSDLANLFYKIQELFIDLKFFINVTCWIHAGGIVKEESLAWTCPYAEYGTSHTPPHHEIVHYCNAQHSSSAETFGILSP